MRVFSSNAYYLVEIVGYLFSIRTSGNVIIVYLQLIMHNSKI
jgi:hypothetical protein